MRSGTSVEMSLDNPANNLRQWWTAIARLLVLAVFVQAVFAGAMLSGAGWAIKAHWADAALLIVSTLVAALVSLVTLRRVPNGLKFALALMTLAVTLFVQTVVGKFVAEGANLMWVHVPLGVALVGIAGQAAAFARKLGG